MSSAIECSRKFWAPQFVRAEYIFVNEIMIDLLCKIFLSGGWCPKKSAQTLDCETVNPILAFDSNLEM